MLRSLAIRAFFSGLFALLLVATSNPAQAASAPNRAHPQVVLQISDSSLERQQLVLNTVKNLFNGYGPNGIAIEVVAFGPGLSMLYKENPLSQQIQYLASLGAHFKACENSMRTQGKQLSDLNPVSEPVPLGMGHIIQRQMEGWAYARP